ncbi:hypothetical protein [Paenibacillus sediminis]|uniref:Uncharacterized protein n=1 Tax=Paenibacillus sediminis TaxID=664909 RepID=A0ABS4H120_9BACL|nr:hypothetical protein [Paenibacillus sediminis]MBP1936228.1 hypothetical protein [Paenibacillus sediminis]
MNHQPILLVIIRNSKDKWQIEAKGETSSVGLGLRTGLGQLIQRIHDEEAM